MIGAMVLQALLGLALLGLGGWGRANQGGLASSWMDAKDRAARERGYRRGALTCTVLGVVFLAAALVGGLSWGLAG